LGREVIERVSFWFVERQNQNLRCKLCSKGPFTRKGMYLHLVRLHRREVQKDNRGGNQAGDLEDHKELRAVDRSDFKSSASSIPIESLSKLSVTPANLRSSGVKVL